MNDPVDNGLAIGIVIVVGSSALCCLSYLIYDVCGCCKKSKPKSEILLNNGESVLSEVSVE